jgi:hypothetical protein
VAAGKTIADYELEGTMRISGVALAGGSYIEVRNLVCERFANDGFNVHGSCQGLVFRNIVSRWNGDDGFSVHEDVGSVVLGGHFHHNDYGIQDINISRSTFYGVLVENNRLAGADFYGGVHVLVDSVLRDNAGPQIQSSSDRTRHMRELGSPFADGQLVLKSTLTSGGDRALFVRDGRADIFHCTFAGAREGVRIGPAATVEMVGSAVLGCAEQDVVCLSPTSLLAANLYSPGRMTWAETSYEPTAFADYRTASGQDATSIVTDSPTLAKKQSFRLFGSTLPYGKSHLQPGIERDPVFPFGEPIVNQLKGMSVASSVGLRFDFESTNPWSRVFPWPEKTKAGEAVTGTSELSTEQSNSGAKSVKLDVTFPPGRPGPWLVKLFSVKFPATKPVTEMRFAMFGDGSGLAYQPRLRDGTGECFYGPAGTVDWQGWREIVWNLSKTPPALINSGDGNHKQDGPTLELVLEVTPKIPAEGGHLVLYLDDLQAQFEE